jgi:predicted dehydrogenase
MTGPKTDETTRRELFRTTGRVAAASALAGVAIPLVHAGEDNTIKLAIVGCGGRGTGAVGNALSVAGENVRLVAMADLFGDRLDSSYKQLKDQYGPKVDVPRERRFLGFDAYKKAIDCLKPGDVALLTTHAAFRPTHLDYAVEKGVNIFMEKTFAPDPGGVKQVLRAGQAAEAKNLKLAAGLMCRHSVARQAMIQKIRDGGMGTIELIRAYRMGPFTGMDPWKPGESELLWQIRRPYYFHWLSSGLFIEMNIHQIDECCWIKDALPVSALGLGGRTADSTDCSQNLDTYSVEYTFADGTKALVAGRYVNRTHNDFATYVHGTKCAGQFSGNIHAATVNTFKDQRIGRAHIAWKAQPEQHDPWQAEWYDLLKAIRADQPYNESRRACMTNLAALMGRAAVHTGSIITWDEMTSSSFQFCHNVAQLTKDSPSPVGADSKGRYPAPVPGEWTEI